MCSAVLVQEVLQRRREPWRWERSGRPSEIDNNPLRGSLKPTLIQLHEKLPKNSASTVLWSFNIWSKLERWKGSISGCLMSWLKIKKIIVLKCRLLLFYATTDNFLVRLWCAMKSGFYSITGDNQLSGWSTSQSQTCTIERSWSLFGHLLLSYLLQLSEFQRNHHIWEVMLSTSVRCTKTHNACSWSWSTEWAQFFSMTLLSACLTTSTLKLNKLGYTVLPHPFIWPLANQLSLLQASWQLFAGKILPQPRGCRKCFTRVHQIPKPGFLHYKNKLISCWQKCVDCNDSYFDE